MVVLYLNCTDDEEAKEISKALLEAKLIACARRWPIDSMYWWGGKINDEPEVLLMMESLEEKYADIEKT